MYYADTILMTEGAFTNEFYILLSGKVNVTASGVNLAVRQPGDLLGGN